MLQKLWLLALVLLPCFNVKLHAAEPDASAIDFRGRPEKFHQGKATKCAVWLDDDTWEMRMTGKRTRFMGTVTSDDKIKGEFSGLEKAKKPKNSENTDWIFVHKDGKGFDFQFTLHERIDGLKFKTGPKASKITFKIQTAGDDNPKHIVIGKSGVHPPKNEFTFPIAAKDEKGKKK